VRDLIIFGAGQIAEVAHYYFAREAGRKVVAFAVDRAYRTAETVLGVPVVDFEDLEQRFAPADHEVFVAMSFRKVNQLREAKVAEVEAKGYALASHASPRATVWPDFVLQPNTLIMEHNVIQPFVTVGKNVIMWSGNHVGHHSRIGDNCFIASHAVISGNVEVGAGSFIGVNATLRDNIVIGARNVIGAGALILGSTEDNAVYSVPATPKSPVPSTRLRNL
jgi:sugar O-acyltransferase (sialic acid O-acetyltransferase NeuD family)